MTRRPVVLLSAYFLWLVVGSVSLCNGAAPSTSPINVIVVFIDDMGWSDLSCFGCKEVKTENIDRLADEGIRFTNFYVNMPICSPSRVALTTGQYPQRWRVTSFLANRKSNTERGIAQWLALEAPTVARQLALTGYATGHFGKWHMGGQRDVGDAPLITQYGFDTSLTNFEGLGPRVLPLLDAYGGDAPKKYHLGSGDLGRGDIRWEDRSVVTSIFVKDAIAFMDQSQQSKKPFYLNLWPDDVHSPFFPPKELRKGASDKRGRYLDVLKALDQQLGVLFDRVRRDEQLRNNTLILLASDNGPEPGAGSAKPLRGSKGQLYEGGIRSPLIVWGPGLIPKVNTGVTNATAVLSAIDLNRSVYAITNAPLPTSVALDGEDLSSTLLGRTSAGRQSPLFWRRPPDRGGENDKPNPDLAVRDGRWKFYLSYDGGSTQLYNLDSDVSESNNVAGLHPDIVDRLTKAILKWNAELPSDAGDPAFPSNN